jgi:hypothetical protein
VSCQDEHLLVGARILLNIRFGGVVPVSTPERDLDRCYHCTCSSGSTPGLSGSVIGRGRTAPCRSLLTARRLRARPGAGIGGAGWVAAPRQSAWRGCGFKASKNLRGHPPSAALLRRHGRGEHLPRPEGFRRVPAASAVPEAAGGSQNAWAGSDRVTWKRIRPLKRLTADRSRCSVDGDGGPGATYSKLNSRPGVHLPAWRGHRAGSSSARPMARAPNAAA